MGNNINLKIIGYIKSPYKKITDCPKNTLYSNETAEAEILEEFTPALATLKKYSNIILFYWLHYAKRDILQLQKTDSLKGVFALRSQHRPNPIGIATVKILEINRNHLKFKPVDCINYTPLIDIKPSIQETEIL